MTDVTRCSEGELFNADARLGARILETAGRLAALDKQARRTPPRTLLAERRKVEAARLALDELRELAILVRAGESWEMTVVLTPQEPPAKRVRVEYASRRRAPK